jgi:Bacteriocin-protection, YdeI or OmpD-Associated/Domain of unknown function (DUF1905)
MTPAEFSAEILSAGGGGHAVVVPKEIAGSFAGKRPAVLARVGGVEYRSRLAVYGGKSFLGLRKELLRQIGREAGEVVEITLEEDLTEVPPAAEIDEPAELLAALAENQEVRTAYEALPPSHRREYAKWIGEAKQAQTRAERVARMVRRLSDS